MPVTARDLGVTVRSNERGPPQRLDIKQPFIRKEDPRFLNDRVACYGWLVGCIARRSKYRARPRCGPSVDMIFRHPIFSHLIEEFARSKVVSI